MVSLADLHKKANKKDKSMLYTGEILDPAVEIDFDVIKSYDWLVYHNESNKMIKIIALNQENIAKAPMITVEGNELPNSVGEQIRGIAMSETIKKWHSNGVQFDGNSKYLKIKIL